MELTLRQKIGQLLMVGFDGTTPTPELIRLIEQEKVGSIILFSRNMESAEQVTRLTEHLQTIARDSGHPYPLVVATDQENGVVRRLPSSMMDLPGNMVLGAIDDLQVTHDCSDATANLLKSLGVNMNLAPVLDCNSNPDNPVIGVRSFGENVQQVAKHGVEFLKAHASVGVLTSGKHFPGHGDTFQDSHEELPVVSKSLDELRNVELIPFTAAINNGVSSLLVSHVHYTGLDPVEKVPASLSVNVISNLLRDELGFDGLVLTDCLEMKAISQTVGVAEGALRALQAGADIPIISHTYSEQLHAIDRIERAVLDGELAMDMIEKSLKRINEQKVKLSYAQADTKLVDEFDLINYQSLAKSAYEQGVTVVKGTSPFTTTTKKDIHAIWMVGNPRTQAEDKENFTLSVRHLADESVITISEQWLPLHFTSIVDKGDRADMVVLFTDYPFMDEQTMGVINDSLDMEKLVVVSIRSPYVLAAFHDARALIACYEPSNEAIRASMDVIVGKLRPTGVLPITLAIRDKYS